MNHKNFNAIIYAAGTSSRFDNIVKHKCLLKVKSKELIVHQVEWILKFDPNKLVIVLGDSHEEIKKILENIFGERKLTFVYNVESKKGNMLSLWSAREYCNKNCLLTTSDLIIDRLNIDDFMSKNIANRVLIDKQSKEIFKEYDPVKISLQNNLITKFHKNSDRLEKIDGISVGIYYFSNLFMEKIIKKIQQNLTNNLDDISLYKVFNQCMKNEKIFIHETINNLWADIDDINDYNNFINFKLPSFI
jgi:choline kinase